MRITTGPHRGLTFLLAATALAGLTACQTGAPTATGTTTPTVAATPSSTTSSRLACDVVGRSGCRPHR